MLASHHQGQTWLKATVTVAPTVQGGAGTPEKVGWTKLPSLRRRLQGFVLSTTTGPS